MDRPWHDYAGESSAELFALVATHRADSLVVAFEQALEEKLAAHGEAALSTPEWDVLAIEGLEREVNNGGYSQYLVNSAGTHVARVVAALHRVGCAASAEITSRALAAGGWEPAAGDDAVAAALLQPNAERDAALAECDRAYFASDEDIAAALLAYLERRREEVRFPV